MRQGLHVTSAPTGRWRATCDPLAHTVKFLYEVTTGEWVPCLELRSTPFIDSLNNIVAEAWPEGESS